MNTATLICDERRGALDPRDKWVCLMAIDYSQHLWHCNVSREREKKGETAMIVNCMQTRIL